MVLLTEVYGMLITSKIGLCYFLTSLLSKSKVKSEGKLMWTEYLSAFYHLGKILIYVIKL